MNVKDADYLKKCIGSVGIEKLRSLSFELINRLYDSGDIDMYLDDNGYYRVYWNSSGDDIFE